MALSASTIWEVQTTGDDTNNGGAFDPSQTAGMFTDGAATSANTSAPVFTSASYNFVAGDAGAWMYISSGTNWTPGWYKISSVASNAATLNGTIGQGVLKASVAVNGFTIVPTTVAGCATTASPTGATWTIDYSQQAAAQFTYTDLASVGTGLTVSSVAKPFAKQQVGNSIVITGGTNFNTGRYVIASVAASVATVVGPTNITTGAGVTGTGGLGGALASPGKPGALCVDSNLIFIKTGTYSITSATFNIAGGCMNPTNATQIIGYGSVRGDMGTPPLLQASGISTFELVKSPGISINLKLDGATLTSSRGFNTGMQYYCQVLNCTNSAYLSSVANYACTATGCTTAAVFSFCNVSILCEAYANTITPFQITGACIFCISRSNTGASTDGFTGGATGASYISCIAYGNGRDGFRVTSSGSAVNCIAEANTGWGFTSSSIAFLVKCASYNNTLGANNLTGRGPSVGFIANTTGSFFNNAAGNDFSLNSTASQGALARAAGIPGVFPAASTTGYHDIGAAQHADPAALIARARTFTGF